MTSWSRGALLATVLAAGVALALILVLAPADGPAGSPVQPAGTTGRSPLAAYPGFGHDPEADEARFAREELARERRIAACMQRQGFRYMPAPSLRLEALPSRGTPPEAPRDPNQEHVETLDDDGRRAYYLALYGIPDPFSEAAEDLHDPAADSGGGCAGEALRAIPGVYAAHGRLAEELGALRRAVADDPRVRAAEQRWAACMAERGIEGYGTPRDLRAAPDQARASTPREGRETARRGAEEHRQDLEAGRACGAEVGLATAVDQARVEHEAAFVERHRALLDRHRESLRRQERLLR